jgi:hypothetical protein
MKFFKRMFCTHNYVEVETVQPITFFGIGLFSQYKMKCTLCGKERIVGANGK